MADNQTFNERLAAQQQAFNTEAMKSASILDELKKQSQKLMDGLKAGVPYAQDLASKLTGVPLDVTKAAENVKDLNTSLGQGTDITTKLKNEILESGIRVEKLEFQRQINLNKLSKTKKEDEIEALMRANRAIDFQLKSEGLVRNQLGLLQEFVDKEKEITEEKKKQNDLGELLKKKYESIINGFKDVFTLGSLIDMLFKGSENIANFRKELGISYSTAYSLNTEIGFLGNNVFDAYINGEKLKKSFTDLSKAMGFVSAYGNESLVTMTNLTGRLGLSNTEAAQLTTLSRMQSTNTERVLDNVGKTVSAMNMQGKTTILLKDVMKDIATTSKATAVSLGSNPVKIAEAVVAAKQLGTTLQQIELTADSLLNFESSIENELKAELLTGKQMNLERARAAALANDMKTLAEEIGKNEAVIGAFASGNRLAQEATAKALGMNRDQLAAMVYQQEAMKIGAEGVRAKYGEQAYEQLKAQSAQEKFNNSIDKLKSALSSVVQIFSPIIDLLATVSEIIANIISQWYILYPLIGLIALNYLPKIVGGFTSIGKSVIGIGASIKENFTKMFSKGGFQSMLKGEDKTKETVEKVAGAGDKTGAGGPKAGEGIKNTLEGISAGIKSFSDVNFKDIAKVGVAGIALAVLTPAIPALLLLQFVNGKAIQLALEGIGAGLQSIGIALKDPKLLLGLAAFTGVMIGWGFALGLAAPAIKAIGEAIGTVINAIASGVSIVINSLGDMIVKVNETIPALLLLGPALFGISAGLAAMGFSGILALPTMLALTALGAVAPALVAIGIGGGKKEKEKENINTGIDLTPMIAAINEVKAAVDRLYNKDITINMDSKKVGSTLVQSSYQVA